MYRGYIVGLKKVEHAVQSLRLPQLPGTASSPDHTPPNLVLVIVIGGGGFGVGGLIIRARVKELARAAGPTWTGRCKRLRCPWRPSWSRTEKSSYWGLVGKARNIIFISSL